MADRSVDRYQPTLAPWWKATRALLAVAAFAVTALLVGVGPGRRTLTTAFEPAPIQTARTAGGAR